MHRRLLALLASLAVGLVGLTVLGAPASAVADRDCSDFRTQAEAQRFYNNNGGRRDPHRLDADGDGQACESLPAGGSSSSSGSGHPGIQRARVTRIVDGDTIKVRLASGPHKTIRMIGIDTPEVYGGVECGGRAASRQLKRMVQVGDRVSLVADRSQANRDRYGRILRYVMHQGRDLNRAQVRTGHSKTYVYDRRPFKRVRGFRLAQAAAKRGNVGLWRTCW